MNSRTTVNAGPVQMVAKYASGRIELWLTPCIVSMPPPGSNHCLLVPSNERLCGTQFSHFPAGGPTPSAPKIGVPPVNSPAASPPLPSDAADTSKIAQRILYPYEAVDGVITELGGLRQEQVIQKLVPVAINNSNGCYEAAEYPIRCPTGEARLVPAVGMLHQNFDSLVLAVAPLWKSPNWEKQLHSAFVSSFNLATGTLAVPLLGAGTRGIPVEDAARIAAESTTTVCVSEDNSICESNDDFEQLEMVRFCVQDEDVADVLDNELSKVYDGRF